VADVFAASFVMSRTGSSAKAERSNLTATVNDLLADAVSTRVPHRV